MTRQKKARGPGKLGPSKNPELGNTKPAVKGAKRSGKGHRAGHRQGPSKATTTSANPQQRQDPRLGSTKAVPLVKAKAVTAPSAPPADDRLAKTARLEALENDPRLNALLDQLDAGQALDDDDQQYLDDITDQIDKLMSELGIDGDGDIIDDIDWDDEEQPA